MIFIGDLHGNFEGLQLSEGTNYIQVGDFGVGFVQLPKLPNSFYFIRGNHDNPSLCQNDPHYLGDYGVKVLEGKKIFYVSGAASRDYSRRTPALDLWIEEEISHKCHNNIIALYLKTRPDIVVTHDAPSIITGMPENNKTVYLLNILFNKFQPKLWVFGHHHRSTNQEINNTRFIGLAIGEKKEVA